MQHKSIRIFLIIGIKEILIKSKGNYIIRFSKRIVIGFKKIYLLRFFFKYSELTEIIFLLYILLSIIFDVI